MSCSSSHYQAPGFYPLRWLKYVGPTLEGGGEKEENEIEHIDVDDESPPPPLKTTFEIAKPLLDNTPFLRYVVFSLHSPSLRDLSCTYYSSFGFSHDH